MAVVLVLVSTLIVTVYEEHREKEARSVGFTRRASQFDVRLGVILS